MKRSVIMFLQVVVVLFGIGAVAFLLWEPHLEGRNAHATVFAIYFKDPFLAYVYVASVPFFMALYQAFNLLGYLKVNHPFSVETVKALRTIKQCALTVIGFVVVSAAFIPFGDPEDRPPGVFLRILVILGSVFVAFASAKLERIVKKRSVGV